MNVANGPDGDDSNGRVVVVEDVKGAADTDAEVDHNGSRSQGDVELDATMEMPYLTGCSFQDKKEVGGGGVRILLSLVL